MPKWWAISWTTVTATSSQHLLAGPAHPQRGAAEDRDPVGERAGGPEAVPLGERHAVVHAQQVGVLRRRLVLARGRRRCPSGPAARRDGVEGVAHGLLELLRCHQHRSSLPRRRVRSSGGRPAARDAG